MSDANNEIRLVAAQMIWQLWTNKDLVQLNLLKQQLDASIEDVEKEKLVQP